MGNESGWKGFTSNLKRMGFKHYANYLGSLQWKVFCVANKKDACYCCGGKDHLQVHHITYVRMGHELPTDVVTVCSACHLAIHKIIKEKRAPFIEAHIYQKREIGTLL